MLHSERTRLKELAAREAAGENLWHEIFDKKLRTKILYAMQDTVGPMGPFADVARKLILTEVGLKDLVMPYIDPVEDFTYYLEQCSDSMMPDVIEAFIVALQRMPFTINPEGQLAETYFVERINILLRECRISFIVADNQMTPISSFELHQSIIEPAIRLLRNSSGWEKVESAYREALDEIKNGKPDDAITDASRALEEALKLLGCSGNSLGKKITAGVKRGIISAHDVEMLNEIEKVMHWVSADRSEKGDSHPSNEADLSDAWFHVHIVGAILVRLNESSSRKK